jgi:chromosome segregation ATPase
MEFEQLVKRIEWMDEENRKTRAAITRLDERMAALEANIDTVAQQLRPLPKQIADIASTAARLNQFDAIFAKQREDMKQAIDEIEKRYQKRDLEVTKRHHEDLEPFHRAIDELRRRIESEIPPLKHDLKARILEESRLNESIKELKPPIDDAVRIAHEAIRTQNVFEEARRAESKRVADLQGELSALRKRIDEVRSRTDLGLDSYKNIEGRIRELTLSESERKAAQIAFIEQQSIVHIDRERSYKEWKEKFDNIKITTQAFDAQVLALEEALRKSARAQDTYTELNAKLERRINEVTEMQRLAEDRIRQEWVTFKADDQKRWTGYTLSQDEGVKDVRRLVVKMEERIPPIEDLIESIQDQIHQTTSATEQQLQELMNVAHEWLSAYERIMGHGKAAKKTTKKSQ